MRSRSYSSLSTAVLLGTAVLSSASPTSNQHQKRQSPQFVTHQDRADAVKEAFQFAWNGYYKYAFPNDDLQPVDNTFSNPRNGWGASAIDALSTAIVMELPQIVNQIVTYVPKINYDQTDTPVSLFETTIRYLGGMLAGYDLLTGPFQKLAVSQETTNALLSQSKRLANDLSFAFNTPSGVPVNDLIFSTKSFADNSNTNGLATVGTLVLEWTRLADLTGNTTYAQLSQKGESYLLNPQPAQGQPFPGLVGTTINTQTGQFEDAQGGWQGGDDSFYEYLIKMYVYDSSRFGTYKDRWIAAADSSIKYLASHPSSRSDLTFLDEFSGTTTVHSSQHLACFDGGNFILAGLALKQQKYVDFGIQLTASCHNTYNSTATRIGPESFAWLDSNCQTQSTKQTKRSLLAEAEQFLHNLENEKRKAHPEPQPDTNGASDCTSSTCETSSSLSLKSDFPFPWFNWAHDHPQTVATSTTLRRTTSTKTVTSVTTITRSGGAPTSTPSPNPAPSPTSSQAPAAPSCTLPSQYADQQDFYNKNGFYITNPTYDLRPEVMESVYYAYRATGDQKYQDWAWDAFLAINSTCRVGSGFSQINNVNVAGGGGATNVQESFFFAELMKYLYLIQSRDGEWQVNYQGNQDFVFNTEAHPLRVKGNPVP